MLPLNAFNLKQWIDENRELLKPPVGNRVIWEDRELMAMVVGGPNSRTDYHINEGEEFFYQLEGDMVLRILEDGKPRDIAIRAGDIFLLPPNVPHSPQRPAGTVGFVLERRRLPHEIDHLLWICDKCHAPVFEQTMHLTNAVTQLPPAIATYRNHSENRHCKACGHTNA